MVLPLLFCTTAATNTVLPLVRFVKVPQPPSSDIRNSSMAKEPKQWREPGSWADGRGDGCYLASCLLETLALGSCFSLFLLFVAIFVAAGFGSAIALILR